MKAIFLLFFCFLYVQYVAALTISEVSVSTVSDETINISINTEAVELYYFSSWQYSVAGTTIVLEACFIPGFGSTIAYLNNNFQIPINTIAPATYRMIVKAYYNFYEEDCLQDRCEVIFKTPLPIRFLSADISFVNPSDGKLLVSNEIASIFVLDATGRMVGKLINIEGEIELYDFADGLYLITYFINNQYKVIRIILKKQ